MPVPGLLPGNTAMESELTPAVVLAVISKLPLYPYAALYLAVTIASDEVSSTV